MHFVDWTKENYFFVNFTSTLTNSHLLKTWVCFYFHDCEKNLKITLFVHHFSASMFLMCTFILNNLLVTEIILPKTRKKIWWNQKQFHITFFFLPDFQCLLKIILICDFYFECVSISGPRWVPPSWRSCVSW